MSDDSAIIGDVPAGEVVEVLNSFFGHYWKIRYKGIVGWVKTDKRDIWKGESERKTLGRIN